MLLINEIKESASNFSFSYMYIKVIQKVFYFKAKAVVRGNRTFSKERVQVN